jgi:hypothetical protein
MSQAKRDFYARLEPLRALLEETGGGASMTDGTVWIQVRGFGTRENAAHADATAAELMFRFGRTVASIHPSSCRIAAKPGSVPKAGICDCSEHRWVRREQAS